MAYAKKPGPLKAGKPLVRKNVDSSLLDKNQKSSDKKVRTR